MSAVATGATLPAATLTVAVVVDVPPQPSVMVYMNVAAPVKLGDDGANETTPVALMLTMPFATATEPPGAMAVPLILVIVKGLPSGSLSFWVSGALPLAALPLSTSVAPRTSL